MRKVKVPVIRLRISHTSFTVFARISIPFTSSTSSPSWSKPLLSAAPPFTILPIITASPSFRTVAPWKDKGLNKNNWLVSAYSYNMHLDLNVTRGSWVFSIRTTLMWSSVWGSGMKAGRGDFGRMTSSTDSPRLSEVSEDKRSRSRSAILS